MFSRIGCSAYRSPRGALNKGAISGSYGVRLGDLAEISSGNGFAACENCGFGLLRNCLTSAGAGKQIAKVHHLKELDSTFANLRLRRLFCNQAPEKEESGAGEQSNTTEPTNKFQDIFRYLLLFCSLYLSTLVITRGEPEQISFEEFKNELVKPGLVDHIVVSNNSYAKVYVKSSPAGDSNGRELPCRCIFYFNIESVKSLLKELKEFQESLGGEPLHYVPVNFDSRMKRDDRGFSDEFIKILLTFAFGALWGRGIIGGRGWKGWPWNFQIKKMIKNLKHNS